MNREHVIGHPRHLRLIAPDQPLKFVGHGCGLPAPMRLPEDLVAAPSAMVGTASRGDERNGNHAVMLPPDLDISRHTNRFTGGRRLSVDIPHLLARFGPDHRTVWSKECNPFNLIQLVE